MTLVAYLRLVGLLAFCAIATGAVLAVPVVMFILSVRWALS